MLRIISERALGIYSFHFTSHIRTSSTARCGGNVGHRRRIVSLLHSVAEGVWPCKLDQIKAHPKGNCIDWRERDLSANCTWLRMSKYVWEHPNNTKTAPFALTCYRIPRALIRSTPVFGLHRCDELCLLANHRAGSPAEAANKCRPV
jgi:hypothetical protein